MACALLTKAGARTAIADAVARDEKQKRLHNAAGPPLRVTDFGPMHLVGLLSNPYTAQSRHGSSAGAGPRCSAQALLQRWDLRVYLRSRTVVQATPVPAAGVHEELDAVAFDSVVAGVHRHPSERADLA